MEIHAFTINIFFTALILTVSAAAPVDVVLVEFLLSGQKTATSLQFSAPTLDCVEEDLKAKYSGIFNISRVRIFDQNITTCDQLSQKSSFWATRFYYREVQNNPVMIFFAAGCNNAEASLGSLARAWNKPLMIPVNGDPSVANKKRYPTVTRISPFIQEDLNSAMHRLLRMFYWNNVTILCDDADDHLALFVPMCTALHDSLRLTYNISSSRFYVNASNADDLQHYLEEAKSISRVILLIGHGSRIRPIMLGAAKAGMTNGEYVYIAVELYPSRKQLGTLQWYTDNKDGQDEAAKTAFRSLLKVSLRPTERTTEYLNFMDRLKNRATNYGYFFGPDEALNPFALSYYYAAAILFQVMNETVSKGNNLQDGVALSRLIRGRTYDVMGHTVAINWNGDRDAQWIISQTDPSTGDFRPILEQATFNGVYNLTRSYGSDGTEQRIVWYNSNHAPLNEPRCGYRGLKEECKAESFAISAMIVGITVTVVLVVGLLITLIVLRKSIWEALRRA
ncbi:putative Atrial natriuretic peptide receptor 1 [Hypsibius exemplaris]|uniref:Atrial natriuretic peptide receptor 1 n=1 Tax=Hypsibius exemplaris TaxID=2072580 RepID=A0A1W0XDX3_HYPEX|nr:putative Atrial natriuretic peptide receptor 1 [Hypsibius exemplaris]